MKRIIFILVLLLSLSSCGKKSAQKNTETTAESTTQNIGKVYEIEDFLLVGGELLGDTVKVRGHVKHTCKHAGKRCFLSGKTEDASIRVEAGGSIGGFNKELIGSELEISGIVRERHIEKSYVDEQERATKEKIASGESTYESCHSDFRKIEEMRLWMKENKKDYFPIYFLDGLSYEIVGEDE